MRLKKCRLINGLGEVYILKFGHGKHNAQFGSIMHYYDFPSKLYLE